VVTLAGGGACRSGARCGLDDVGDAVEHTQDGGRQAAHELLLGCGFQGVLDGVDLVFVGLDTVDRHELGEDVQRTQDLDGRVLAVGHHVEYGTDALVAALVVFGMGREGLQSPTGETVGGLRCLVLLGHVGLAAAVVRLVIERVHQGVEGDAGGQRNGPADVVGGLDVGLRVVLRGLTRAGRARAREGAREPAGVGRLAGELPLALARDGTQQVADEADAGGREAAGAAERDVLGDDLLFRPLGAGGREAAGAAADEVELELADSPSGSGVVAGVAGDELDVLERLGEHLGGPDDERAVGADAGAVGALFVQIGGDAGAVFELLGVPALCALEALRGTLEVLLDSDELLLDVRDALGELRDDELLRLVVVALAAALGGHVLDDDGAVLVERDDRALLGGQFGGSAGLGSDGLLGGGLLRCGSLVGHGSEPSSSRNLFPR
jgi:hypothetical protein